MDNIGSASKFINSPQIKIAIQRLETALKANATQQLLSRLQTSSDGTYSYFDDILGNSDTLLGQPHSYYEDRVFSTSTGLNALLDIWVETDETASKWNSDCPSTVQAAVRQMVAFIV